MLLKGCLPSFYTIFNKLPKKLKYVLINDLFFSQESLKFLFYNAIYFF